MMGDEWWSSNKFVWGYILSFLLDSGCITYLVDYGSYFFINFYSIFVFWGGVDELCLPNR